MKPIVIGALIALLASPVIIVRTASAGEEPTTKCRLTFDLKGWSAFYKRSTGTGLITCDNGQTARIKISTHGGGITFGKSEIINGSGTFSRVKNIGELFGSYAASEAHAGAVRSSGAQAMTKGNISLAISGTGRGVDLGFAFGKFKITQNSSAFE